MAQPIDDTEKHQRFLDSTKPHVLMITNHGVHQWKIVPGLPDTGGQNVFVNFFTDAVAEQGYRVTIVNRGGFAHPESGEEQKGLRYKDDSRRILYLEDGTPQFIQKEKMAPQIPALTESLQKFLVDEGTPVDLICSHYWDSAALGAGLKKQSKTSAPHIWVPHSLGAVKKRNMEESRWEELQIDERIAIEQELIPQFDRIASTSGTIESSLAKDYGYENPLFLPPCVDTGRYYPREVRDDDPVWEALGAGNGLSVEELRKKTIVVEVSRTDATKRKDILIRAFAKAAQDNPDLFLAATLDRNQEAQYSELNDLIDSCGIRDKTAVLGSVWDLLPSLYAASDIYCTPSVMEGFGMSIQEGAASGLPAVSSNLVPFAVEYLAGEKRTPLPDLPVERGEGAYIVEADQIDGFAAALTELAKDEALRTAMGKRALEITVPYFTWEVMTRSFLEAAGLSTGASHE